MGGGIAVGKYAVGMEMALGVQRIRIGSRIPLETEFGYLDHRKFLSHMRFGPNAIDEQAVIFTLFSVYLHLAIRVLRPMTSKFKF